MIRKLIKPVIALSLVLAVSLPSQAETTYKVGSTPTGIPFTFLNTHTNTFQGMIIDLSEAIAEDQNVKVEVESMSFGSLIPSLMSGKIDIIAAAMGITEKRKEVVDFTQPVYIYGECLVIDENDSRDYKTISDLNGAVVGVQSGSLYVDPLKEIGGFKEIKYYASVAEVVNDVKLGRIQAGIVDYPIVAYQINKGTLEGVKLAKNYKPVIEAKIAMAVPKGDTEVLNKLDASIVKLKADGTIEKMIKKWGL